MSVRPDFDRTDRPSTAQPPPVHQPGKPSAHAMVVRDLCRRHEAERAARPAEQRHLARPGYDQLAALLEERAEFGRRKYGTPLQVDNGRDSTQDVLEELGDAVAYAWCAVAAGKPGARMVYEQLLEVALSAAAWWCRPPGAMAPE